MSAHGGSPKGSLEDGPAWVDKKKRPRPEPLVSTSVQVSRHSGLHQNRSHTTFGKADRLGGDDESEWKRASAIKKLGHGASSPKDHHFYKSSPLYKIPFLEEDKTCTQGIGPRPGAELPGPPPHVGPGSYNIIASAAKQSSPLDGAEFCKTSMKIKLPSDLTSKGTPSPGPHAKYDVRKGLVDHLPRYGIELLKRGHRSADVEDRDQPGPGQYFDDFKSVAMSSSCPNLPGNHEKCMEATGGSKRSVKTTFGVAERFPAMAQTSSPIGRYYYAHSSQLNEEDYLKGARSCSFGVSGKTDFSNPLRGHRSDLGPGAYKPQSGYSAAMKTSPIDGFAFRTNSPINTFSRNMGSSKSGGGNRPRGLFRGDGASPGAGAGGGSRKLSNDGGGAAAGGSVDPMAVTM